jgi:TniQ
MFSNIPVPFPDECARGYMFRISALHAKKNAYVTNLLPTLVRVTGLDLEQWIKKHTHIGYMRYVSTEFFGQDISRHADVMTNTRVLSGGTPLSGARMCTECIEDDVDRYGVSYWKRLHQLPGIDFCIRHEKGLSTFRTYVDIHNLPLRFFKDPTIDEVDIYALLEREAYQRFLALSQIALNAVVPIATGSMGRAFTKRFNALHSGSRTSLKELLLCTFPHEWLERHFRIYADTERVWPTIDYFSKINHHIQAIPYYLLVMALLWDDPNEAVQACLQEEHSFDEVGARLALKDVLRGRSITWACRMHKIEFRDFELALQEFFAEIRPAINVF